MSLFGTILNKAPFSGAWADLTGKPTTLAGYGITDAATSAQGALADTATQPADLAAYLTKSAVYNNQTGTSYTIQASDNGKILTFENGSAIAVTLPDGLDANFQCSIVQIGAGVPTVTPGGSDTVNGAGTGVAPSAQWKGMFLSKYDTAKWLALV